VEGRLFRQSATVQAWNNGQNVLETIQFACWNSTQEETSAYSLTEVEMAARENV
jgi:hypothetical protein